MNIGHVVMKRNGLILGVLSISIDCSALIEAIAKFISISRVNYYLIKAIKASTNAMGKKCYGSRKCRPHVYE